MKNLYTNSEAVKLDLINLGKAQKQLVSIRDFLMNKGIDPDEANILNATKKVFTIPIELFRENETAKIKKVIEAFGETSITDGWEGKVNEKTEAFQKELINLVPDFDQPDYLKYFSGVTVKEEFNNQYFIDKHSVILSNSNQLNFYIKHQKACELLNELMEHSDNEFEALNKLFYFNPESKEFELNLLQYHDIKADREAAKMKIESEKYSLALQNEKTLTRDNVRDVYSARGLLWK